MAVFAGYGSPIDTKIVFESNPQWHTYTKILVELVAYFPPPPPPFPSRTVFDPFFYQQAMMIHKKVLKIGNGTELAWEKICFR